MKVLFRLLSTLLSDSPPAANQNESTSTASSITSQVTHSILVTDGSPVMTFSEALTRNQHSMTSETTLLSQNGYVQWNQTSPPIPTTTGLMYTPP